MNAKTNHPLGTSPQTVLEVVLSPLREGLMRHPLYGCLHDDRSVRIFMETHVFAVWDFQSLLTALQRLVTCVEVPWIPTADPEARRLINEIVLDEESDEVPGGGHLSHFEMYFSAMKQCGANTQPIEAFVEGLRRGFSVEEAMDVPALPAGARPFVRETMKIALSGQAHRVAAAFTYGRENVIPAMFRRFVEQLSATSPDSWSLLRHYLDRHIQKDSEEHGPQAELLVKRLCGNDEKLWSEAKETAEKALRARALLWDQVAREIAEARTAEAAGS
ncbi:MAG: DUF3050 domain-containing protein [Planctomycetota bacterium]|nr:DUF3050 domain-containing protein [Planctomycetota bacterium]